MLSLRIAFSDSGSEQADQGGAIAEIAEKPFGTVLLWLLGIALAGMALWRLTEAAFGQAGPTATRLQEDDRRRPLRLLRVRRLLRAVVRGRIEGKRQRQLGQGIPGHHGEGSGLAGRAVDRGCGGGRY